MHRTGTSYEPSAIGHVSYDVLGPGHGRVSLRWVLAHLVEEIARHAGHADMLRELTDGQTGR